MGYVNFAEVLKARDEALRRAAPIETLDTLDTLDGGKAETPISGEPSSLVSFTTDTIDIIDVFAPEPTEGLSEERALSPSKVSKPSKVPGPKCAQNIGVPSPDWWRDEFDERAAIREFDGHYTRAEAERVAWGELENRWHKLHGERVSSDLCAGCRRRIGEAPALDLTDGNRVHDSPGHECLTRHGARWRGAATAALIEMGLTPPASEAGEQC